MFSKNLKYYRLSRQLSKKELAEKARLTPMAITNYENGDRKPNMKILQALADALEVRVSDFLVVRDENLRFSHAEFRKSAALPLAQQEFVRECVEEYFSRFMTVVEILGGDVLPAAPSCHTLTLFPDAEKNAAELRSHLGFAVDGPIEELIGKLENKGILVYALNLNNNRFSGMNGFVNDRPYIIINAEMNPERIRSTIVHELAHLMFFWPETMEEKEVEKMATAIGGAFLFPEADACRELGIRRTGISRDMELVAREYGISMMLLVKRAELNHIVSAPVAKDFFIMASKAGWRTAEPSRIVPESPALFEQLVYRAVNEAEISAQRGAELLKVPFEQVEKMCCFDEV